MEAAFTMDATPGALPLPHLPSCSRDEPSEGEEPECLLCPEDCMEPEPEPWDPNSSFCICGVSTLYCTGLHPDTSESGSEAESVDLVPIVIEGNNLDPEPWDPNWSVCTCGLPTLYCTGLHPDTPESEEESVDLEPPVRVGINFLQVWAYPASTPVPWVWKNRFRREYSADLHAWFTEYCNCGFPTMFCSGDHPPGSPLEPKDRNAVAVRGAEAGASHSRDSRDGQAMSEIQEAFGQCSLGEEGCSGPACSHGAYEYWRTTYCTCTVHGVPCDVHPSKKTDPRCVENDSRDQSGLLPTLSGTTSSQTFSGGALPRSPTPPSNQDEPMSPHRGSPFRQSPLMSIELTVPGVPCDVHPSKKKDPRCVENDSRDQSGLLPTLSGTTSSQPLSGGALPRSPTPPSNQDEPMSPHRGSPFRQSPLMSIELPLSSFCTLPSTSESLYSRNPCPPAEGATASTSRWPLYSKKQQGCDPSERCLPQSSFGLRWKEESSECRNDSSEELENWYKKYCSCGRFTSFCYSDHPSESPKELYSLKKAKYCDAILGGNVDRGHHPLSYIQEAFGQWCLYMNHCFDTACIRNTYERWCKFYCTCGVLGISCDVHPPEEADSDFGRCAESYSGHHSGLLAIYSAPASTQSSVALQHSATAPGTRDEPPSPHHVSPLLSIALPLSDICARPSSSELQCSRTPSPPKEGASASTSRRK